VGRRYSGNPGSVRPVERSARRARRELAPGFSGSVDFPPSGAALESGCGKAAVLPCGIQFLFVRVTGEVWVLGRTNWRRLAEVQPTCSPTRGPPRNYILLRAASSRGSGANENCCGLTAAVGENGWEDYEFRFEAVGWRLQLINFGKARLPSEDTSAPKRIVNSAAVGAPLSYLRGEAPL